MYSAAILKTVIFPALFGCHHVKTFDFCAQQMATQQMISSSTGGEEKVPYLASTGSSCLSFRSSTINSSPRRWSSPQVSKAMLQFLHSQQAKQYRVTMTESYCEVNKLKGCLQMPLRVEPISGRSNFNIPHHRQGNIIFICLCRSTENENKMVVDVNRGQLCQLWLF